MKSRIIPFVLALAAIIAVVMPAAARADLLVSNYPLQATTDYEVYEDSGPYHNGSGYFALRGAPTSGSFYRGFGALDFKNVAAKNFSGQTVASVTNLTLSLYNTQTSGTYGPTAGNFNVYLATDTATALATGTGSKSYDASGSGYGPNGDGTNSLNCFGAGVSSQLIGTFAFDGSSKGFYNMSFPVSDGMSQQITNALNASGSVVRLVVAPVGNTAADFDGFYSSQTAKLSINGTVPEPGTLALCFSGLTFLAVVIARRRRRVA